MKRNVKEFQSQKFINVLFHELRIPISSIHGYASLFISGELGKVSKSQLKIIQKIRDLTLYASELINNFLSLSSLDGQKIVHYEKVSLPDTMRRSTAILGEQIRARSLKVHSKFSGKINFLWAFPVDTERIIINILSNAIKFTPKNGHIYITVVRKGNEVYLSVRDTGIGIPPEATSKIFESFYRADNVISQYEGFGLGLSIVEMLLKRNNGTISIKSRVGEGTSVEITLPILTDKEAFEHELGQVLAESTRLNASFGLVMIAGASSSGKGPRLDLFKKMNRAIRKKDRSYQISKDRYIAILPGADYIEARLIAEKIKSPLQKKASSGRKGRRGSPGLVAGVAFALFPTDGSTKEELLSFLDRKAKKASALIAGVK